MRAGLFFINPSTGKIMNISLWDYYQRLADRIGAKAMAGVPSRAEWTKIRPRLVREYFQSMGLDPLPDYRSAEFRDGGVWRGRGFQTQRIAWQILPDCWNSACIYWPDPMPPRGRWRCCTPADTARTAFITLNATPSCGAARHVHGV